MKSISDIVKLCCIRFLLLRTATKCSGKMHGFSSYLLLLAVLRSLEYPLTAVKGFRCLPSTAVPAQAGAPWAQEEREGAAGQGLTSAQGCALGSSSSQLNMTSPVFFSSWKCPPCPARCCRALGTEHHALPAPRACMAMSQHLLLLQSLFSLKIQRLPHKKCNTRWSWTS